MIITRRSKWGKSIIPKNENENFFIKHRYIVSFDFVTGWLSFCWFFLSHISVLWATTTSPRKSLAVVYCCSVISRNFFNGRRPIHQSSFSATFVANDCEKHWKSICNSNLFINLQRAIQHKEMRIATALSFILFCHFPKNFQSERQNCVLVWASVVQQSFL